MRIEEKAILLSAESKQYTIEGRTGISHKVRFFIGDGVFPMKATPEQVKQLRDYVGQSGILVLDLVSRKENLSLSFVSFE